MLKKLGEINDDIEDIHKFNDPDSGNNCTDDFGDDDQRTHRWVPGGTLPLG